MISPRLIKEAPALLALVKEMLELAENWPGVAYTADLESRARASVASAEFYASPADYMTALRLINAETLVPSDPGLEAFISKRLGPEIEAIVDQNFDKYLD